MTQCPFRIQDADSLQEQPSWWRCQSNEDHAEDHAPPSKARTTGPWFAEAWPEVMT